MAEEKNPKGPIRVSEHFSDVLVVTLAPIQPPLLPEEEWKPSLLKASDDLLVAMGDRSFKAWMEDSIPESVSIIPLSTASVATNCETDLEQAAEVGSDQKWPMTVSIDFALTVDPETGVKRPQLIELQAFPTVGLVTLCKFWLYYSRATPPIVDATAPSCLVGYRSVVPKEPPSMDSRLTEQEEIIFRKVFFQTQDTPQTAEKLFEQFLKQVGASVGGLQPLHGLHDVLCLMATEPSSRLPQEGLVHDSFHTSAFSEHGTILVEIQPDQQKTFLEMQLLSYTFGMPIVCIRRLKRSLSGKTLEWVDRNGKEWSVKKIYSRVVPTELIHKMGAGFECAVPFAVDRTAQKVPLEPLVVPVLNHPAWYMKVSKHSMPFLHQRAPQWVPKCEFLTPDALRRWTEELCRKKNVEGKDDLRLVGKVVKPLFELGGAGLMMEPTVADVEALLAQTCTDHSAAPTHLLMDLVQYSPVVPCSDGGSAKAEIRVLCYGDGTAMPKPVFSLARLSRDEKVNNVRATGPGTKRSDLPVYSGSAPLFFQ